MIRRLLVVTVALLVAGTSAGCGAAPSQVTFTLGSAHRNLTYCHSETLDLYVPRTPSTQLLPVAVYVHGGGMTSGDKSDITPVFLDALASAGYAVASVNYRLAPQFKYPAQIEDVTCAIRFLRHQAARYRLDGGEVFAFGTSVGGELVALLALTGPHSAFDAGPYASESSSVRAVADLFGPANLSEPSSGFSHADLQQVFGDDRAEIARASPTHFVVADSPPVLIVQGVQDSKVLESQSIELYRDLRAKGDRAQLVLVQHMGHMFEQVGSEPLEPGLGQIAADVTTFFSRSR